MTGKLILISGRKGTGKTYVTEYLEGMLAGKVEIYPMATMLKRIVAAVTNCSVSQLDSHYLSYLNLLILLIVTVLMNN